MDELIKTFASISIVTAIFFSNTVAAVLLPRAGGSLVYDTETNLTWLADANYASTIGYNPDNFIVPGYMVKDSAQAWISAFTFAGFTDWRLPNTVQPDASCSVQLPDNLSTSYNCIASELGNLFYVVMGGEALAAISATHNTNYNIFKNINDNFGYYWASPDIPDIDRTWAFRFDMGYQNRESRTMVASVWPVRVGDPLVDQPPDGDANFDGVVNASDVNIVVQIIIGQRIATPREYLHLDIAPIESGMSNPNGVIDTADLIVILRKAFK